MITVYQAVPLPAVAGPVHWRIAPQGTGRVRLRAVVAALSIDGKDQIIITLDRTGQEKLVAASGELDEGYAIFGINLSDTSRQGLISAPSPTIATGGLHDIWFHEAYQVTLNALTNNVTVATIGCWIDYEED